MFALILAVCVSISDFGAKSDGSLCTDAFARAIGKCAESGGGRVEIPAGEWFTGPIRLKSGIELHIDDRATVRFSDDLADFQPFVPTTFEGRQMVGPGALIYAYGCTNVAVTGGGTFTTEQSHWRKRQLEGFSPRPHFIQFNRCKGIRLDGFKLLYSPACWFCEFFLSEDIVCRNLCIFGMFGNSDGFDFESSRHGLVENCRVDNGDDAFCIKSGRDEEGRLLGVPSEDIEFRNCHVVRSGCFFVVGSEISGGARNIRIHDCTAEVVREVFVLRSAATRGGHVEDVKMWNCDIDRCEGWFFNTRSGWPVDSRKIASDRVCWTTYDRISVENVHVGDCGKIMNVVGPGEKPYRGLVVRNCTLDWVRDPVRRVENVDVSCRLDGVRVLGKRPSARPLVDANRLVGRRNFAYEKIAAELSRAAVLVYYEEPEGSPDRELHWERLQNLRRNGYELDVRSEPRPRKVTRLLGPSTWNAVDGADGDPENRPVVFGGDSIGVDTYERKAECRRARLPSPRKDRRYFVRADGVSAKAKVFVNGAPIGEHRGAFTGFTFEITDRLNPDGNWLEIEADNRFDPDLPPINGDFTLFGGAYRDVWLIETPRVAIDPTWNGTDGIRIRPNAKTGEVVADICVSGGTNEVRRFRIPNFRLWTPEDPVLYPVVFRVEQGGCRDEVCIDVGFRTVEFREDGFYLNGEKRVLRGVNRHQDFGEKGWAADAGDEEADVRLLKELGADAVRTAHYPQSKNFYSLCDRYGLLAWCEIPCLNAMTDSDAFRANVETVQREMVAQLGNHPSIAMWGVFNEMYHAKTNGVPLTPAGVAEPMLKAVNARFHELDPTRPTVAATNDPKLTDLNSIPDAIALNDYPGWYGRYESLAAAEDYIAKRFSRQFDRLGRPTAGVSEYGAGGSPNQHAETLTPVTASGHFHPEEYQAWVVERQYRAIAAEPRTWGSFVWCLADFAADSRREGERDGINDKGLVTRDRKTRKTVWKFFEREWKK